MDFLNGVSGLKILMITAFAANILGQIERDIILTPELSGEITGRTLYYKAAKDFFNSSKNEEPWEIILKHLTYLTLNGEEQNLHNNISDLSSYQKFLNSSFIKSKNYVPKFGDIITMATGRLEQISMDKYRFVEGQCTRKCDQNNYTILAFWGVQKIRHRDPVRKYRFELKFSVSLNSGEKTTDNKRELGNSAAPRIRSFILRDQDYPTSFHRLEENFVPRPEESDISLNLNEIYRDRSLQASARPYDEEGAISSYRKKFPELNIGEYVRDSYYDSNNVQRQSVFRFPVPTTYRPNNHIKYQRIHIDGLDSRHPIEYAEQNNIDQGITTHLHHHYYLTKNKFPDSTPGVFKTHLVQAHDAAVANRFQPSSAAGQFYEQTKQPIANQIPVPPSIQISSGPYTIPFESAYHPQLPSPIILMSPRHANQHFQQTQIVQPVPAVMFTANAHELGPEFFEPTKKTFEESPQYETIHFSQLDPLYRQPDSPANGFEDQMQKNDGKNNENENENEHQIQEGTSSSLKPDSINAQLPPSEIGQDIRVPYVETSVVTEKSSSPVYVVTPTITITSTEDDHFSATSQNSKSIKSPQRTQEIKSASPALPTRAQRVSTRTMNSSVITKLRSYQFPTTAATERPVLRWMQKTQKLSRTKSSWPSTSTPISIVKSELEKIPVNVTDAIFDSTVTASASDVDVPTKQSVSSSISVKVGYDNTNTSYLRPA